MSRLLAVPDVRSLTLVVEDRALFVQTDDRGVRKIGLKAADRREESAVDVQLAAAVLESGFRRDVSLGPQAVRLADACDLVRGLDGAPPIQPGEESRWVLRQTESFGHRPALADGGGAPLRQPLRDLGDLTFPAAALDDLETFGPEGVADPLGLIPEVVGGKGCQQRLLLRAEQEQVAGALEGTEMEEVGVRPVGGGLIVAEVEVLPAGNQDQSRVPGFLEILGDSFEAYSKVLAKRTGKGVGHGARRIRIRGPVVMP